MECSSFDMPIIDKAFALREQEAFNEALEVLKPLIPRYANNKGFNGLLATIYYEMGDFLSSEKYFAKGIELNPNSELTSMGLFHSFFENGKILLALRELERYTTSNSYEKYQITIDELKSQIHNYNDEQQRIIRNLK